MIQNITFKCSFWVFRPSLQRLWSCVKFLPDRHGMCFLVSLSLVMGALAHVPFGWLKGTKDQPLPIPHNIYFCLILSLLMICVGYLFKMLDFWLVLWGNVLRLAVQLHHCHRSCHWGLLLFFEPCNNCYQKSLPSLASSVTLWVWDPTQPSLCIFTLSKKLGIIVNTHWGTV